MSMDDQSCHFFSFHAILYSSNHLIGLPTSCIMYNLVPTPHSIPDYILITSAGTPGWLPVLGSQHCWAMTHRQSPPPRPSAASNTLYIVSLHYTLDTVDTQHSRCRDAVNRHLRVAAPPPPPSKIFYMSIHHLASPQRDAACGRGPGRSNVYCLF